MNKQIIDLYEQASSFASEEENPTKSYKDRVMLKFVQLIVQECMTINKVETSALDLPEYNLGMLEGYRRARENMSTHFGVEE